jgi:hypothetical protein
VNIYAPSGSAYKAERDTFFNTEVVLLLPTVPTPLILCGDFNCVLTPGDCTGVPNFCRGLTTLVQGFGLMDIWNPSHQRPAYTHYTSLGAARLDRIYTTTNLFQKKTGAEILFAPFTDHLAVEVRLTLDIRMARRGKGTWKLNNSILQDPSLKKLLLKHIAMWKTHQRRYDSIGWWDSYVKTKIKHLFIHMRAERRRDMTEH